MNIVEQFIEISQISKAFCAEILGVSPNTVYNMLKQEKPYITIYQLEKMVNYLQENQADFVFKCPVWLTNTFQESSGFGFEKS